MSDLTKMLMRRLFVVSITYGALFAVSAQTCELAKVRKCLGGTTDLLPDIYFRPLDSTMLIMLRQEMCNRGLETCLSHDRGNCSETVLAPYGVVVNVANFLCHTDLNLAQSCIVNPVVQHSFKLCFNLFKVLVDSLVTDPVLDKAGLDRGMCLAYVDLSTCVAESSFNTCDERSQTFITDLMNAVTHPTRDAIGCTEVGAS